MTKSWLKKKKKQFCNTLRNYTAQNEETPPNPPIRKSPPKRKTSAVSAESALNVRQTKTHITQKPVK